MSKIWGLLPWRQGLAKVSESGSGGRSGKLTMEEWLVFLRGEWKSGSGGKGGAAGLGVLELSGTAKGQDLVELSWI